MQFKVVAFLQNQWFKDPEKMEKLQERMGRERFIRTFLFWSCLTGKRLRNAFGEDICDHIIWEEASKKMGGHASAKFPADHAHIRAVLETHQPKVVLAFGAIATVAVGEHFDESWQFITGPHPAARGADICNRLKAMADKLRSIP